MEKKKVLIITYYWPPSAGSGVQRWLKFVKYLPEYGWEPHVYTPENPDFDIKDEGLLKDVPEEAIVITKRIWEPYKIAGFFSKEKKLNAGRVEREGHKLSFFKKMITWIRGNIFIPDPRIFWVKPSVKFLYKYIKSNQIKNIISTGPPHSMHLIAKGLKKKLPEINWIADFRDPLSNLDMLDTLSLTSSSRKKYERIEQSILNTADRIITVTPGMKHDLLPFDHSKMTCITNGFDGEDFRSFKDKSDPEKIVIYHAGVMNLLRNPIKLWEALDELLKLNPSLKEVLSIKLVGNIDPRIISTFEAFENLEGVFEIEGYKKHDEILKDYEKANILLLLLNNSKAGKGSIPGKTFEYLATGKKIICFGVQDSDTELILNELENTLTLDYESPIDIQELASFIQSRLGFQDLGNSIFDRKSLTKDIVNLLV